MDSKQTVAMTYALAKLQEFLAKSPMSHEDMREMMSPVFTVLTEANIPEEIIIMYDYIISTYFMDTVTEIILL